MTDFNIALSTASPITNVSSGDKITWTNDTGLDVSSFVLPTCVPPQPNPAPIAVGATTRAYTVNSGAKGSYTYEWVEDSPKRGTRSGTINVN